MSTYIAIRAEKLGIPVVEATKPVLIDVTDQDASAAKPKNSKCCAFARAAKRLKGVKRGYFFRSIAYLEYPDKMVRYELPPSVRQEIISFDRSRLIFPGTYQLSPPHTSRKSQAVTNRGVRAKAKKEKAAKAVRKLSVKKSVRHQTQGVRMATEPTE
jgi:hypothetical protein